MKNINILTSDVFNRISAGEVVERPSSVVKELVENALDAGANEIFISITNGGIKNITITDNGKGMSAEDLALCFFPHATSKIKEVFDLDLIQTLGFRGEALPSIGAVSVSTIQTCEDKSGFGHTITCEGGVLSKVTDCGTKKGTTVSVNNLFFNTPARLKFLKSNKQEEGMVTNIVARLMLSNPNVNFNYKADGKTIFNSNLKGLKEKIFDIYGKDTLQNMVELQETNGETQISGYISRPTFCKPNRTYQTLIVNGRFVSNTQISVAIANAYSNFLMKGKFPMFVLNVNLPPEDLDVNVHPSKMEVRFKNTNGIYSAVYTAVLETLQKSNFPTYFEAPTPQNFELSSGESEVGIPKIEANIPEVKGGFSFGDVQNITDELKNIHLEPANREVVALKTPSDTLNSDYDSFRTTFIEHSPEIKAEYQTKMMGKYARQEKVDLGISYKTLGTIFNTYILLESEDNFYMLDQHAGHERVLFDKFMKEYESKKLATQPLLLPYIFTVNPMEKALVENNLDAFNALGFEVESFGGNSYKVVSVPVILSDINLEAFVSECLENLEKISTNNEQIKHHFATCACKAAVKGGQNLTDEEIRILLKSVLNSTHTLLCPHGRPICVKFSRTDIEKLFKRIV